MEQIARMKITLQHMPRPVWRRVEVPLTIRLEDLHDVIQTVMPWDRFHLWQFSVGREVNFIGPTPFGDPVELFGSEDIDCGDSTLADACEYLTASATFTYHYDFGVGWIHKIKIESLGDPQPDVGYPRLIKAMRRCPPEDVGGPWGYREFLDAKDPDDPNQESYMEWDPDALQADPEVADQERLKEALVPMQEVYVSHRGR